MPCARVSFVICLVLSLVLGKVHAPDGSYAYHVGLTELVTKMLTGMPLFCMVYLFRFHLVLQFVAYFSLIAWFRWLQFLGCVVDLLEGKIFG